MQAPGPTLTLTQMEARVCTCNRLPGSLTSRKLSRCMLLFSTNPCVPYLIINIPNISFAVLKFIDSISTHTIEKFNIMPFLWQKREMKGK